MFSFVLNSLSPILTPSIENDVIVSAKVVKKIEPTKIIVRREMFFMLFSKELKQWIFTERIISL